MYMYMYMYIYICTYIYNHIELQHASPLVSYQTSEAAPYYWYVGPPEESITSQARLMISQSQSSGSSPPTELPPLLAVTAGALLVDTLPSARRLVTCKQNSQTKGTPWCPRSPYD